jgi:alpha-beta hydrolase superfamily lysophospholipase
VFEKVYQLMSGGTRDIVVSNPSPSMLRHTKFPNQPVQIIAHSLGGLMTFAAMRDHPEKYSPGAVVVGVPFGTGIQYFQDLHKGGR